MADKREFLVVIDGRETASTAAGKVENALGKLGDQARDTEHDFDGLDRKMRDHAETITNLRQEIVKTGDVSLFKQLGKEERAFGKLDGLKKSLVGAAGDAAPEMAVSLGGRLGPLLARLPVSGPMGIALAAAAAAAAPSIGATIAGAIVGGASIGGVVGGAMIAGKDPRVKAAFSGLGKEIGVDLRQAAAPFVPAMLDAAKRVRAGFKPIGQDLRSIFAASSNFVAPLTEAALRATKSITGGLSSLISGAGGPAIQAISDGLIDLGDALGDVFKSLSDNGPETALALSDLFDVLEGGIRVIGGTVNGLTELYGKLRLGVAALTGDTDAMVRFIEGHRKGTDAAKENAKAVEDEGRAAYTTAQMVDLLTAALDRQVDDAMSAAEANLRYKESLVAAKEAVDKKKGASLAEERQLLSLISTINETTRTNERTGVAAEVAGKQFAGQREQLIKVATQMFGSKAAAERYVDGLLKIPKSVSTKILLNEAQARSQASNIQKAIKNIKGKTVYINIARSGEYGPGDQGAMHGPSRNAAGGPVKAGEISWVGEEGKELLVMPRDGYVINNRDSAMLAAGGGLRGGAVPSAVGGMPGRDTAITLTLDLLGMVRKTVRVNYGGNVQLALGTG